MSEEPKVGLLEMVLWAEREQERVEAWRRVLRSEGQDMDPGVAHNGLVARKVKETLELVMEHQGEFVAMVQLRRKDRARVAAEAASRSTAPSSGPSTSTTPPTASGARSG